MGTARIPKTVTVRCPEGHRSQLPAEKLAITHTSQVVVGVEFPCGPCGARVRIHQAPAALAMLVELQVPLAISHLPEEDGPPLSNEHRRTLSARLLGDRLTTTESSPRA